MIVRVLLDTCAVRKTLHRDEGRLDFALIQKNLATCKLSIAGPAVAELTGQLLDRRIPFDHWTNTAFELNAILDPNWPLFPNGKQLAYLAETQTQEIIDIDFERCFLKAVWEFLRQATSVEYLLGKKIRFRTPTGVWQQFELKRGRFDDVMRETREFWVNCVRNIQQLACEMPNGLDEAEILRLMMSGLGTDPHDAPNLGFKLDAVARMVARLFAQSLAPEASAYDPEGERRRGDAFDLDLLLAIPLPVVIVTADKKFANRLRGTGAPHERQVCLIDEFHDHLAKGTLSSLVSDFRTADEQFRQRQETAYHRWVRRGRPVDDAWADWFAAEPIA